MAHCSCTVYLLARRFGRRQLYAGQDGRSLYRVELISIEMIPGTEAFEVPKDATKAEAHHALAMFLDRLGWGPMVDQAGNIVDPSKADPNEPVRW